MPGKAEPDEHKEGQAEASIIAGLSAEKTCLIA